MLSSGHLLDHCFLIKLIFILKRQSHNQTFYQFRYLFLVIKYSAVYIKFVIYLKIYIKTGKYGPEKFIW